MSKLSVGDRCIIRNPSPYQTVPVSFFEGKHGTIAELPTYDWGWNQPVAVLDTDNGKCIRPLTYLHKEKP